MNPDTSPSFSFLTFFTNSHIIKTVAAYGLFLADGRTCPLLEKMPLYRATPFGEIVKNETGSIICPNGSRYTILIEVNPIRAEDGHLPSTINCWRDITELKQLTAEREVAYAIGS